jgi:Winged helix DNA-binding domain
MTITKAREPLSDRQLNRATLARQALLQREPLGVTEAIERLVGVQSQEPQAPYVALWSRLVDFEPHDLSRLIESGLAIRGPLMRSTLHLVTAADWSGMQPLLRPMLERDFRGSAFDRNIASVDRDELVTFGERLLRDRALSRMELGALLAERWPDIDPQSMAQAVTILNPCVQVPPRGLWRASGPARWLTSKAWLADLEPTSVVIEDLALRYLAAFGPATILDLQAWCGLTRMRAVVERLEGRLRSFVGEQGEELWDVEGARLPNADTPAPPRFLAPFDNAILAYADRSRIVPAEFRSLMSRDRLMRTFLVDGFVAGTWRFDKSVLSLTSFRELTATDRNALLTEAERLAAFLAPDSADAGRNRLVSSIGDPPVVAVRIDESKIAQAPKDRCTGQGRDGGSEPP